MKPYDVIIIGGGASGLYLAATLGGRLKTALIERGARVGRKLSATGGGQGNLSNSGVCADRYFCGDKRLVADVLGDDNSAVLNMFDGLFVTDARGRIYPAGRQASSLTDCLRRKASACSCIMTETRVTGLRRGFVVMTDKGELRADNVAICTGGKAGTQFGTDGSAYELVTSLGHTVTPLYPSLVQLKTDTSYIKTLRGVRTDCFVRAYSGSDFLAGAEGEVIFNDTGVGGNAIYYISPFIAGKPGCRIELEFLPGISESEIVSDIKRKEAAGVERGELLSITLNNVLGRAVIRRAGNGDASAIARLVKRFGLTVTGDAGFGGAQVTRGGVPLSEVTDRLESRLVKGLYFAGEVLDVDGECGGYNLHWAFASAKRVAESLLGEKL